MSNAEREEEGKNQSKKTKTTNVISLARGLDKIHKIIRGNKISI